MIASGDSHRIGRAVSPVVGRGVSARGSTEWSKVDNQETRLIRWDGTLPRDLHGRRVWTFLIRDRFWDVKARRPGGQSKASLDSGSIT